MTTLVTGAAGFVGSHAIDELLAQGTELRALVRDANQAAELRRRGIEVVVGDMRDPAVLREAVRGAQVVYHCAAAVGPKYTPHELYDINFTAARQLLDVVRESGNGRVVLLTSVNVLGTRHLNPATEDVPCRRSRDAAADVKIDIENLAWDYDRRHGVDATALRLGMIYGPRDPLNLPKMISALRRGKFAFIGSRDHIVPIVHVSDVVQAMLLAGRAPTSRGRAYHITDGSRVTIGEFVDHLSTLIGCPLPSKVLPYAVPYLGCVAFEMLKALRLYRGPAPIARNSLRFLGTSRYFDIGRARQELGFVPRVQYREGLAAAVPSLQEPSDVAAAALAPPSGNAANAH